MERACRGEIRVQCLVTPRQQGRATHLDLGELREAEFGDGHARRVGQLERVEASICDERLARLPAVSGAVAERKIGLVFLSATIGRPLVIVTCSFVAIECLIVRLIVLLLGLLLLLLGVLLALLLHAFIALLPRALLSSVILLTTFLLFEMVLVHRDAVRAL